MRHNLKPILFSSLILLSCNFPPAFSDTQARVQRDVSELINLSLEELLDVEVITASKTSENAQKAPSTLYVITDEQIKKLGLRDLKDVLALVPGVDTSDNHFFLQGGQRGFMGPFSQSLIMINGREMNNLIAGETFIANQFRLHNLKQIEIIAGPGSALYGANAVGGIINLITKTPEEIDGAELQLSYGSFNSKINSLTFGTDQKDFKIAGSIAYYDADEENFADFLSNTQLASPAAANNSYRHLPNKYGYNNHSVALPASFYIEKNGFYGGLEYYKNVSGRGTASIQWDYTHSQDYRELLMKYVGYKQQNLLTNHLDVTLEHREYWERFWGNHTESTGALENPLTGATLTDTATEADVEAYRGFYSNKRSHGSRKQFSMLEGIYHFNPQNTLVAGIEHTLSDIISAQWSRIEGKHPALSESNQLPEFKNYQWSTYAQTQNHFLDDTLILTLGARWMKHERYGYKILPRYGIVYQPIKGSIFKALYGKSFREPTVFELSSNLNIKPMEMDTYELSWHQYLGEHFKNEIVAFSNRAKNRIVSDDVLSISNGGKFYSRGIENVLSFKYQSFNGFLNYTYMDKVETEDNGEINPVYDIPRHKANFALIYDFATDYSLGIVNRYRGATTTEYQGNLYRLNNYLVTDTTLHLARLPWLATRKISLDIIAKNIFDKQYYHPEPRDANALQHPQEGRSLMLQFSIKLD
jgi:outer membrane receptor for ferrienterochelin and colicin